MANLRNVPAFEVVGILELVVLSLPQLPWTPSGAGVGGGRRMASGVAVSYQVRSDEFVEFVWRVADAAEEETVRDWLRYLQYSAAQTRVWPDYGRDATFYVLDLESPAMGQEVKPAPDPTWPGAWRYTFKMRIVNGVPWSREFHA